MLVRVTEGPGEGPGTGGDAQWNATKALQGEEGEEGEDEEGEADEDEDEADIPMDALSDDDLLHPDAMPKQKVEIDNKV